MKKQYIFTGVLVVLVAALAVLAIYKHENTTKGLTLHQAVSQRDSALQDLSIQKALDANDQKAVANLTSKNSTLLNDQTTLCAQIVKAKLPEPTICEE